MLILSLEDILKINEEVGYKCVDKGSVDFLISKITSLRISKDTKRNIAKVGANIWYYIITAHPFLDGNKRTATEALRLFLSLNNAHLNIPLNGIIYISLKIANKDISLEELMEFVYEKLEVKE